MRLDIRLHSDCVVETDGQMFQSTKVEKGGAWVVMLDGDTTWVR